MTILKKEMIIIMKNIKNKILLKNKKKILMKNKEKIQY